jgi:hypothetical protein
MQTVGPRARPQHPITANGLMDIITNFATSEEAVGAIFGGDQGKGGG